MGKVFHRSEKAHQHSMEAITKSLTPEKALVVLHKKHKKNSALLQVADALARRTGLRKAAPAGGYSGIEGAKALLNDMIFESSSKYDAEIAKCTEYYSKQCGLMQEARGQISASNYIAANSRMHILDAQGTIGRCEEDIPTRKLELKQHNSKCKSELRKMNARLKIVLEDIEVISAILKMTECGKNMLVQFGMMKCEDPCNKKGSFISFKHKGLKKQLRQLKSDLSHKLTHEMMSDLFNGIQNIQGLAFHEEQGPVADGAVGNETPILKTPTPRTEVPANPCNDPNMGAPSAATKRAAKCTISDSPMCDKLQERFLLIQSGIMDERDDLMEEVRKMEDSCGEVKDTLETQIRNDESTLGSAQTKLAAATESEASAGETARQTSKEFNGMNKDLLETMKTCNTNYVNFETEVCALKKIRGELYKMQGGGNRKLFFVDCSVTKWDSEECTKMCGGGSQKLVRGVITHPNGGAKCLPLEAMRSCNMNPCPVNCRLNEWSGWSKCSAQCGGGVMQRLRDVAQAERYGGKPCGETSETKACNSQACEKDCVLSRWSKWGPCSKDCDGGTSKRMKFVKEEAVGEGKCPDKWAPERMEYRQCNQKRCVLPAGGHVLPCDQELDVVILLDGSASLKKEGWDAEIVAAQNFISSFQGKEAKAQMSVILFSGPRKMKEVKACIGKSKEPVDQEKCGITMVTHFNKDMKRVNQLILGLEWPRGSTLTSLALSTAKAELALGRKNARAVVVVFTDGRPFSYRKTAIASRDLRKQARLMWVPITKRAPLKRIKKWATRRWQENIVIAKDYAKLANPNIVNHIIADICPKPKKGILKAIAGLFR